ncbi:MAG: phosphoglycerate kinase [Patescibacteria group bacterium]|nr:phosphoglycerate kinase [Patescibacteria group bacterium]
MKNIQDIQVNNKNVLARIDADVPIEDGVVLDDKRLQASVPTLKYLLENGAKVTIIGHIGRPKGKEITELKIRPVEDKLIELLGTHLNWQILENLRFNAGEEENDPEFAKLLVTGQDLFVQDAFAVCHRAHASTVGIAKLLPTYAGLSVQREVGGLQKILKSPKEGFTIIIGGKKAEDKLPVITNLFEKAENFLIGGVVANTFLAAKGVKLGKSLIESQVLGQAKEILAKFEHDPKKKLLLPVDLVFSKSIEEPLELRYENIADLNHLDNYFACDLGEETTANFVVAIKNSKTIFWNGNMGISEVEKFRKSTWRVAEAIANNDGQKYAGGGDTTSFIRQLGLAENFDFLSIGGGATLEFLSGKTLPGLEVLNK